MQLEKLLDSHQDYTKSFKQLYYCTYSQCSTIDKMGYVVQTASHIKKLYRTAYALSFTMKSF